MSNTPDAAHSKTLTLLAGYLGAGKTTLLNHILAQAKGARIAVVVNDFGSVNIDASLIQSRGEDTIELTNGCICCQISDDVQRVMTMLDRREDLDHVICEISGVGDPTNLARWSKYGSFQPGPIVTCVDAVSTSRRLADEYVSDIVSKQIALADLLILTKTDLATPAQREASLRLSTELAPLATVYSDGAESEIGFVTAAISPRDEGGAQLHPQSPGRDETQAEDTPSGHESITVTLPCPANVEHILNLLEKNQHVLARAKGFVEEVPGVWVHVELAGDSISAKPLSSPMSPRLYSSIVLIAPASEKDNLRRVARTAADY